MKRVPGIALQLLLLGLSPYAGAQESSLILDEAVETENEQPKEVTIPDAYARMDENGAIIAGKTEWYLEQPDARGRPSTGISWKDGKIARQISWLYYEETESLRAKVETDDAMTTETRYDREGNVTEIISTDAQGNVISRTENAYDRNNRLTATIVEKDGKKNRTENVYGKDGALSQKKLFVDDSLSIERTYNDDNNWTEKVYKNDKVVLVLAYENGVRQEKK